MPLNPHSLRQLDPAYRYALDEAALRVLSVKRLEEWKEARDWLNQEPENRSRPPSRRAPWERKSGGQEPDEDPEGGDRVPAVAAPPAEAPPGEAKPAEANAVEAPPRGVKSARKAGKPPGAPGIGRTQVFQAHDEQRHDPEVCAGCGRGLERTGSVADTGFQAVDLRGGDPAPPGLTRWGVDHRDDETPCACGHRTRAEASQGVVDSLLRGIERSEWRRVGPGRAALIVALAWRFRRSRARIREFLGEWLGLSLSLGTIHQTLHEARAAVAPAEAELIQAVLDSDLWHADETSWPEAGQPPRWRWVFVAATVTWYDVAGRVKERVGNVLTGFRGGLMSDGWGAYRDSGRRWRCWAHRIRQARGLAESGAGEARAFGRRVLNTLEALMAAVYAAREGPPLIDRPTPHASWLTEWRTAGEPHQHSPHQKTHAWAVEFLKGWAAIFQVLSYPELPLTNHEAERALRHGVIRRRLSDGTRTDVGSRILTLLASVVDTGRQRGHSPWRYLEQAIADRRAGQPLAALPR